MECISLLFWGALIFFIVRKNAKNKSGQQGKTYKQPAGAQQTAQAWQQLKEKTQQVTNATMQQTAQAWQQRNAAPASSTTVQQSKAKPQPITPVQQPRPKTPTAVQQPKAKSPVTQSKVASPVQQSQASPQNEMISQESSILTQPESIGLMKDVEEILAKGYSTEMTFERDFVSEGIEMLNRYTL